MSCLLVTGLQVGFEAVKYTVSETEGSVAVCLVASSPYPDTLSFLLYTEQRSAQGKHSSCILRKKE